VTSELERTGPTASLAAMRTPPLKVSNRREEDQVRRPPTGASQTGTAWRAKVGTYAPWLPLALALAVSLVWAARDGGFASVEWLPGTLFVVGLALLVAFSRVRPFGGGRTLAVASLFLAAFTAWCFISITWAEVKGDAWDGANRTLLYLCVFVLFAWRPVPTRVGGALLGAFVAVTAAIGIVDFLRAVDAHRVEGFFIAGRLSTPISYPNANAALFLAPVVPAVFLASRREMPTLLRGLMLACAGVLLELGMMCQSRASLVAFPLTVLIFLAISPGRLRSLLALVAVSVPLALGTGRLLHVYDAVVAGRGIQAALEQAQRVVIWSAVALFAVGVVAALIDRRVSVPARVTKAIGWMITAAAVVAVIASVSILIGRYGEVRNRAATAWQEFKTDKPAESTYAIRNHLTSGFASSRYDIWRVALDEFKAAPIVGVGVDNFAVDYLRMRRTDQEPIHQHSVELRVLAQTGLVGTVLFGGFLIAALTALSRPLRQRNRFAAGVAAACISAFAYWFIHGSVDWFWEVPALGAPAIAWLAMAAQIVPRDLGREYRGLRLYEALPLVLVAGVAAVGLALPWLAAKEIDTASAGWAADPARAFDRLDLARRLNPLSDRADVVAGVIASRLHNRRRERNAFVHALERNSRNWYARLELALLDAQERKTAAALGQLRVVSRLNPREPITNEIRDRIVKRKPISQAEVDRLFLQRTEYLTGARQR
jgi:O-Antigen ligase